MLQRSYILTGFKCMKPVYSALVGAGSHGPYHKAFNGFSSLYLKAPTHTEDIVSGFKDPSTDHMQTLPPFDN